MDLKIKIILVLLVLAVVLLLVWILLIKIKKYTLEQKVKRQLKRGIDKENEAAKVLKKNGFKIISHHKKHYYTLKVGDGKQKISLETDYEVYKSGKKYIVEVKSGNSATSITNSNTRRQILEYNMFIPNDGIILLDMEQKNIHFVQFPLKVGKKKLFKTFLFFAVFVFMLLIIIVLCCKLFV